MDDLFVSVVIPTYNHADFLREAVESVLNQTHPHLELIIVDNYSQDKTEEIIRSFNDARIRYFKFANNGIIASSRNFGIRQAKGRFVAFLDSDDVWQASKLEKQLALLTQDECNGICFTLFSVDSPFLSDKKRVMGPKKKNISDNIYEELLMDNFIVSSSVLVTKKAVDDAGLFDENRDFVCVEDFDLWLRVVKKYKAVFVPEILGTYRKHKSNKSLNDADLTRVNRVIDKHFNNGWASRELANMAKANFYFLNGWVAIDKNAVVARKLFKESLHLKVRGFKLYMLNMAGLALSYVPAVFSFIRRHRIDSSLKKIIIEN